MSISCASRPKAAWCASGAGRFINEAKSPGPQARRRAQHRAPRDRAASARSTRSRSSIAVDLDGLDIGDSDPHQPCRSCPRACGRRSRPRLHGRHRVAARRARMRAEAEAQAAPRQAAAAAPVRLPASRLPPERRPQAPGAGGAGRGSSRRAGRRRREQGVAGRARCGSSSASAIPGPGYAGQPAQYRLHGGGRDRSPPSLRAAGKARSRAMLPRARSAARSVAGC